MPPHKSERDLLDQSYSSLVASVVGDLIHEVVDEMSAMLSREAVREAAEECVELLRRRQGQKLDRSRSSVDHAVRIPEIGECVDHDDEKIVKDLDSIFLNIAILDTLLHVVGDDAEGILVGQIADDILNGILADRLLDLAVAAAHRSTLLECLHESSQLTTFLHEIDHVASRVFSCELRQRLMPPP